jgi:hypothetical protein
MVISDEDLTMMMAIADLAEESKKKRKQRVV